MPCCKCACVGSLGARAHVQMLFLFSCWVVCILTAGQVDDATCASASWLSSTMIRFDCSNAYVWSGYAVVTVGAVAGTGFAQFTYDSPAVSEAVRNRPFSRGASMTVVGLSFGHVDQTMTSSISSAACCTAAWTSSSSVACVTSAAVELIPTVFLTLGAAVGTRHGMFTFDGALLCKLYTALALASTPPPAPPPPPPPCFGPHLPPSCCSLLTMRANGFFCSTSFLPPSPKRTCFGRCKCDSFRTALRPI